MIRLAVTIRTATAEDAVRLNELHITSVRTLCAPHYAAEVIDGWLLNRTPASYLPPIDRGAIFVAELNDRIVGFGEAAPGIVIAVYVDPSAARRGIGRCLLQHAVAAARGDECVPVTVQSTLNACIFYQRQGFREVKRTTVTRNHVEVPIVVMEHGAA